MRRRSYSPPTDKATIGGLPAPAKLAEDADRWAETVAPKGDLAPLALSIGVLRHFGDTTLGRSSPLQAALLAEDGALLPLMDDPEVGPMIRLHLLASHLRPHHEAQAQLAERGAEVAPIVKGPGKEPTTLTAPDSPPMTQEAP